jgi:hypothetical protein
MEIEIYAQLLREKALKDEFATKEYELQDKLANGKTVRLNEKGKRIRVLVQLREEESAKIKL